MCQSLPEIKEALSRYVKSFEPDQVLASDAEVVVSNAASIEAIAHTLVALAGARAAESGNWRRRGHRSAAEDLAARTGSSTGEARDALETARRLADQPEVADAAASGKLSRAQMSVVAMGAEADPDSARRLIDLAGSEPLSDLKDEVARIKAANEDLEARRRAIHAKRRLSDWTDPEGAWHLRGRQRRRRGSDHGRHRHLCRWDLPTREGAGPR